MADVPIFLSSLSGWGPDTLLFFCYLESLFRKVDMTTNQDTYVKELYDAIRFIRSEYFLRRDPTTVISRDEFYVIEAKTYDQLKRLLTDIAVRSTRSRSALEKELKRDRFITAYCNLKAIVEKQQFDAQLSSKQARNGAMASLFDCDSQNSSYSDFTSPTLYPLKCKNSLSSLLLDHEFTPPSSVKTGAMLQRPNLLTKGGMGGGLAQLRTLKLFFGGNNTPGKKKV